jgi:hypothetical protein
MRDPARIDNILDGIRVLWKRYPDMRLGQLLETYAWPKAPGGAAYFVEDTDVQSGLLEAVSKMTATTEERKAWATAMNDMNPKKGVVYEIRCRNLLYGVFDGNRGFIGIREKFGYRYLFTEYLNKPPGHGTVVELIREIGPVPADLELVESYTEGTPGGQRWRTYKPLFDYLQKLEDDLGVVRRLPPKYDEEEPDEA